MLSAVLREETKTAHQELEKVFINKIRSIKSIDDYTQTLLLLYGFLQPIENRIASYLAADFLPDYPQRRKSQQLLDDINNLHINFPKNILLSSDEVPSINNHFAAVGAQYVLEGSTLGGQIISKMIKEKLALTSDKGFSYFQGYGNLTPAMWSIFKQSLDHLPINPNQESEVINSANKTFSGLKKWMQYDKNKKL